MKKLYFLILGGGKVKISYLLLAFLFATTTAATAEVLLNENFEYEAETLLGSNVWVAYGTHPNSPIQLVASGLIYDGYQNAVKGKGVSLGKEASGADAQYIFSKSITEGSLYYAALINLTEAPTEKAGAFITLLQPGFSGSLESGKTGTEFALLSALHSADGRYKLQISRNNTTVAATEATYLYNTTYLVVVKYSIIEGSTNDEVRLYVNPTSATEPTTADALYNQSSGSDLNTTRGFHGIELCQTQATNKNAATLTIDAIRVATTWDELFPSATPEPKPEPEPDPEPAKPAIIAPTGITFNEVFSNEQYEQKITVKGTDLEDDVTFASTCDQVTLSATSATKEQVMSADGFELTLTLKATGETCDPKLTITSKNAPTVEVPIAWTVLPTIDVADLAELRAKAATVDLEALPAFRITNPVVVSYQDGDNYIYLQDDKGGIRMKDELGVVSATTLPTGTKIAAGLLGTVSDKFGYEFIPYCDITIDGTAEVKAVTATLAEIDADKAAYVDRLVRLEHVTFNKEEERVFGAAKDTIIQEGYKAALRLFSSVTDIAGKTIPAQATVVGISTSTSALLIAPRGWSDITGESSTVAIDKATAATICYTQAGMLIVENATTDIAVYNLTGICVAKAAAMPYASFTLPQGVYAVKMNGQTCKVVVK